MLMRRGANQHVEVLTSKGLPMVRTWLRDAAEEIPAETGFQINRPAWVNWTFTAEVSQHGGRDSLTNKRRRHA